MKINHNPSLVDTLSAAYASGRAGIRVQMTTHASAVLLGERAVAFTKVQPRDETRSTRLLGRSQGVATGRFVGYCYPLDAAETQTHSHDCYEHRRDASGNHEASVAQRALDHEQEWSVSSAVQRKSGRQESEPWRCIQKRVPAGAYPWEEDPTNCACPYWGVLRQVPYRVPTGSPSLDRKLETRPQDSSSQPSFSNASRRESRSVSADCSSTT
jgi:hypothetical protein